MKNGSTPHEQNSSFKQQQYVSLKTEVNGQKNHLHLPKRLSDDDDSDDQLMIDERKTYRPGKIDASRGPIKLRLSGTSNIYSYNVKSTIELCLVGSRTDFQITETTEVAANMDIEASDDADPAQNGIGDILRASAFPGAQGYEDLK